MSDTNVRVLFTGNSAGAVRASDEAADSIKRIGRAGREAAHGVDEIRERAERGTRAINEERRALEGLKVASLLGGAATAGKWGLLAGGIASLGAASIGTTAALAPLAGSVAVLPGLLTGAAIALGTVKLATDGVSEALKGNKKALAELTPAGRQFVATLKTFEPMLDKLRTTAQKGLFPGLLAGLNQLKKPAVFAAINTAVGQMAKSLGGVAAQFGTLLASPKFLQTFAAVSQAAAHWMQQFGTFAVKGFDAMVSLTKAAIPLTNWMGDLSVRFATFVDDQIKAASSSGKLQGFFEGVRESITLVGKALGQVGLALFDVLRIAKPFGDALFKQIGKGAEAVRKFVESAKGHAAITAFFTSVANALKGLAPIAGGLLAGIAKVLPPLLNALGNLGRALGPALVPAIAVASDALGGLLKLVSRLANGIGPPIAAAVAVVRAHLPGITHAASSVVNYFRANFLPPLVGYFRGVAAAWVAVAGVFRRNGPEITSILRSIGSNAGQAMKLVTAAVRLVAPVVRALGPVFHALFVVVALEMKAMAAVVRVEVAIIAGLLRGVGAAAHVMAGVVKAAIGIVRAAWNGLRGAVSKAIHFLVDTGPLGTAIGVIHSLMGAWESLRSAASHVITFVTHQSGSGGLRPPPPHRAHGGFIPGPAGSPVDIVAHAGEVIVNQAAGDREGNRFDPQTVASFLWRRGQLTGSGSSPVAVPA